MILKESRVHPVAMHDATRPLSVRGRDRALERLRTLTTGTALAGFVATGAFGTLAAINYAGHSSSNAGTSGASTTSTDTTNQGSTSQSNNASNQGSSSNSNSPLQAAQLPTVQTYRHAHVSSGGSGG
jgi:hypothetical protein